MPLIRPANHEAADWCVMVELARLDLLETEVLDINPLNSLQTISILSVLLEHYLDVGYIVLPASVIFFCRSHVNAVVKWQRACPVHSWASKPILSDRGLISVRSALCPSTERCATAAP